MNEDKNRLIYKTKIGLFLTTCPVAWMGVENHYANFRLLSADALHAAVSKEVGYGAGSGPNQKYFLGRSL